MKAGVSNSLGLPPPEACPEGSLGRGLTRPSALARAAQNLKAIGVVRVRGMNRLR